MEKARKIILFPKLKQSLKTLEKESIELVQKQNYAPALEKLDILLSYEFTSYQINVGKLICLIQLKKVKEAEQFCETLIHDANDEHYYDYLEYYVMILFENNKYTLLLKVIAEEKNKDLPISTKRKFQKLYNLCYEFNQTIAAEVIQKLTEAIKTENHKRQWYLLHKWKELNLASPPKLFINILEQQAIHPVLKTKILEILKIQNMKQEVTINKFDQKMTIELQKLQNIQEQRFYKVIIQYFNVIEQENPTLYAVAKQLLEHYCYVRYPFLNHLDDVEKFAQAFIDVAKLHLSLHRQEGSSEQLLQYKREIQLCNELYLTIVL